MRSLVKLTRDLQAKYRIPNARVVLHRELNAQTECPGDLLPEGYRATIR